MNGRKIQESQDVAYLKLQAQLKECEMNSKVSTTDQTLTIFTLAQNQEALNHLDHTSMSAAAIEAAIYDQILELNASKDHNGNPLISYVGMNKGFMINDIHIVNHKWILANFTDHNRWGDAVIEYTIDSEGGITLTTVKETLYEKYTQE